MPAEQYGRWPNIDATAFTQVGGQDVALAWACSLHPRNEVFKGVGSAPAAACARCAIQAPPPRKARTTTPG
ncbi:hypothetical protein ACIQFZ_36900 [Streptomyces sp. NPDC093064]|uniref:hypothetical protein n=1 Tax=Streptomyces sp. NPDC093064 TaxID=3366020 RepID=UPI00380CC4CD